MNVADLAIAALIAASVVVGAVRGLVVEVLSIAIWAGAVALALALGGSVGEWFSAGIALPSLRAAVGHGLVFLGALAVGAVLMWLLRKAVRSTGLTGNDRLLGLLFGAARGVLLVTVLVVLAGLTPLPRDPWWAQSRLIPWFQGIAVGLAPHLPARLRDSIDFSAPPPPAAARPSS
ncbi:MAG: CvpA family protein [Pseudomonadota bacterium]|jgi:membrane protein required for colicin V production